MGFPMIPMFGIHVTTYKESDMAWMMFYGQNDIIYEPKASRQYTEDWFEARELTETIKYSDIVYDLEHLIEPSCINVMLDYIQTREITSAYNYECINCAGLTLWELILGMTFIFVALFMMYSVL